MTEGIKKPPVPEALKSFQDYKPKTQGATTENLNKLIELLREIWATEDKSPPDEQFLRWFAEHCGLSSEEVRVQEERVLQGLGIIRGHDEIPVSLELDTERVVSPGGWGVFKFLVANRQGKRLTSCKVRVEAEGVIFTRQPIINPPYLAVDDIRECLAHYKAPDENLETALDILIETIDHQERRYAYRCEPRVLLQFKAATTDAQLVIDAEDGSLVTVDQADLVNGARIRAADGAAVKVWGRKGAVEDEGSKASSPVQQTASDQTLPLTLRLDETRTYELQDNTWDYSGISGLSGNLSRPKVFKAISARLINISKEENGAPAFGLPAVIELFSSPLVLVGKPSGPSDLHLRPLSTANQGALNATSRIQGALIASTEGIFYCSSGTHPDFLNDRMVQQGHWEQLMDDDRLGLVRDMFRLKLALSHSGKKSGSDYRFQHLKNAFHKVVDCLTHEKKATDPEDARRKTIQAYLGLRQLRTQVASAAVDTPVRYLRFFRMVGNTATDKGVEALDDEGILRKREAQILLMKSIPIGTAAHMGLRVSADEIEPYHAELEFRDGGYWINNRAGKDSIDAVSLIDRDGRTKTPLGHDQAYPLQPGQEIKLGMDIRLLFKPERN